MKKKYKILIILVVSFLLTFLIYKLFSDNNINYLGIGDGIASGETPYHIDGISYNNYLEENLPNIKSFNTYNFKNNNVNSLILDIKQNKKLNNNYHLKQLIHNANVITIAIGMDEIVKYSITDKITEDYLHTYILSYEKLLKQIRHISESKIIILGFYDNYYLSKSTIIILNSHLANLAEQYDCIFLDINSLLKNKEYFLKKESYYFNYYGHEKIAEIIKYTISTCENE